MRKQKVISKLTDNAISLSLTAEQMNEIADLFVEISLTEYLDKEHVMFSTSDNIADIINKETRLLESYSEFLEEQGYMDSDWRDEEPYSIIEYFKSEFYRLK